VAERVVRTAVVTGAASGFGLAVAGELAGRGADVALLDIDADRLGAAAAAVAAEHGVGRSAPARWPRRTSWR